MKIVPSPGKPLHAKVVDVDLREGVSEATRRQLEEALAEYGVLSFPGQQLMPNQFRDFCQAFGELELNIANSKHEPGMPEMMILSNIVENGQAIGMSDAGQGWHTDLSYRDVIGYSTLLYALEVPQRDGRPLGDTQFCSSRAAYEDLPAEMKAKLDGMTVTHDFEKFWEHMRSRGSTRPPLTPAQRQARPPVAHPIFMPHPITGHKVLYADPGYAVKINELDAEESRRVLEFLFQHQTQAKYLYSHQWQVGDVLMWDNIATIHSAVSDYSPEERRHLKRCQVTASRFLS